MNEDHFYSPEFWQGKGFTRNWGDAAVMDLPSLEILRKETDKGTEFIILTQNPKRYIHLYPTGAGQHWGSF